MRRGLWIGMAASALAAAGILVALTGGGGSTQRVRTALGIVGYFEPVARVQPERVLPDLREHFHHELSSKYFAELGFDGLYAASLAVQQQSQPERPVGPWIRDLRTNRLVDPKVEAARAREVAEGFAPERWSAFVADHRYYLDETTPEELNGFREDHGCNPTPAWTFVARLFSARLPASTATTIFLASLDVVLLGVAFAVVFRTYGLRVASLCIAILGLGCGWSHMYIGAFLRADWLAAVVVAICMLERGRPTLAGALLGYAAAVRVFPALLLGGPALLAIRDVLRGERPVWAVRLGAGLVLVMLLGAVAGSSTPRGVDAWRESLRDLRGHREIVNAKFLGVEAAVLDAVYVVERFVGNPEAAPAQPAAPAEPAEPEAALVTGELRAAILALQAHFLLLFVAAGWRAGRAEALVLAMVPLFAVLPLAAYYCVMQLAVPLQRGAVDPVALLGLGTALSAFNVWHPERELRDLRYCLLCIAFAGFLLGWVASAALPRLRSLVRPAERTSPPRLHAA
jgi:hypothetical protein